LGNRHEIAERARNADLRLPDALVEIRKGLGMTQAEFAGMLFLQKRQIAEIEAGKTNPTLATLQKIGRPFGFEVGFVPRNPDPPK
jgi:putative transcriptional regulator